MQIVPKTERGQKWVAAIAAIPVISSLALGVWNQVTKGEEARKSYEVTSEQVNMHTEVLEDIQERLQYFEGYTDGRENAQLIQQLKNAQEERMELMERIDELEDVQAPGIKKKASQSMRTPQPLVLPPPPPLQDNTPQRAMPKMRKLPKSYGELQ